MKKRLFGIFVIFMGVLFLTGCGISVTNKKSNNNTNVDISSDELNKNITLDGKKAISGDFIIFANNKNDYSVDLTITVEFFDENNSLIKKGSAYISSVIPNTEIAVEIYDTPKNYSSYKATPNATVSSYSKTYNDQIKITDKKEKEVIVEIKNNSDDTIDYVEASIIYYQGENIVGIDESMIAELESGKTLYMNFYNPHDNDYNELTYDSYKIYVNSAYTYNFY